MKTGTKQKIAYALADLSVLLDYPNDELKTRTVEWRKLYSPSIPSAGAYIDDFEKSIESKSTAELEELYTRTFDVAPICTPYITAYLYGEENYERGNLMHKLSERYNAGGFDSGNEMPDHIGVLMRFAPQFSEEELADLREHCLSKTVKEMHASLQNAESPYAAVMLALIELLNKV